MGDSKIGWTDAVWNPLTGCSPVSRGCDNCYAERMAARLARMGASGYSGDGDPFKPRVHWDRLGEPARWRKPRRVFVCSMGDWLHEHQLPGTAQEVLERTQIEPARSRHVFFFLTKRPERLAEVLYDGEDSFFKSRDEVADNLWFGVSAEDQESADERVPRLMEAAGRNHKFVSCEPLLGPVDLSPWLELATCPRCGGSGLSALDFCTHACRQSLRRRAFCLESPLGLEWVIAGGESGPGRRPMDDGWARSLRDQCARAGVDYYFKQRPGPRPGSDRVLDGRTWDGGPRP